MSANESQRRLSSLAEAAEAYGVSVKTIRRYISTGRVTGYRFGPRMLRVDMAELDAMLRPIATGGASK